MMRLGVTGKKLSETLKVSPAGIHLAAMRGEVLVKGNREFQTSLGIYLNT
jgi:hypothetical protein